MDTMQVDIADLQRLEWPLLMEALVRRATSVPGREAAQSLDFVPDAESMDRRLTATEAWRNVLEDGGGPPLGGFDDQSETIRRLGQQGVPEAGAFLSLGSFLRDAETLIRWMATRLDRLPMETSSARLMVEKRSLLSAMAADIHRCLLPDGSINESASPEIAQLKRQWISGRETARREIVRMASALRRDLENESYTLLDDRYVLLVKASARSRHDGIVHGHSQTGSSVYFEPQSVVALTNAVALTQSRLAAAVEKVLRDLAERWTPHAEWLNAVHAWVVGCDVKLACARLAMDMEAVRPSIHSRPMAVFEDLRHPVMVTMGKAVVANSVAIGGDGPPGFVISGPNAGGKTVLLKALGLAVAMTHAGLLVPAGKGSGIGFFRRMFVLMGDEQSLPEGLSTFSSHLRHLNMLLMSSIPGTLLLLDEIATGTEPREGEALAMAFLEAFVERGSLVMVTTHSDGIKHLADGHSCFGGGAMGFDEAGGQPTFALMRGVAGSSKAIAIARLMGIEESVLDRARLHYAGGQREAANLMKRLEQAQEELVEERWRLRKAGEENDRLRAVLAEKESKLEESKRRFLEQTRSQMRDQMHRARDELLQFQEDLKRMRKETDPSRSLGTAQRKLETIERRHAGLEQAGVGKERERLGPPVTVETLQPGDWVKIPESAETARVVEINAKKKRAVLIVGSIRMERPIRDLRGANAPQRMIKPPPIAHPVAVPAGRSEQADCDIRGLTVEEGWSQVEGALDRALRSGLEKLRIIHGHGTGRLREGIRERLKRFPQVISLEYAPYEAGGEGVTVVKLVE